MKFPEWLQHHMVKGDSTFDGVVQSVVPGQLIFDHKRDRVEYRVRGSEIVLAVYIAGRNVSVVVYDGFFDLGDHACGMLTGFLASSGTAYLRERGKMEAAQWTPN